MYTHTHLRTLRSSYQHVRHLHLHEYQSMQLLKKYDVPTPRFAVASTPSGVEAIFTRQNSLSNVSEVVVKAQVLAGGRSLGYFKENGFQGGVHFASSPQQVVQLSHNMLNKTLITKQTGIDQGRLCSKVLIAERLATERERYLAFILDSKTVGPLLVGSSRGGSSIEEIAAHYDESIKKLPIDPIEGFQKNDLVSFVQQLELPDHLIPQALSIINKLYKIFREKDCLLLEVNPLVETKKGNLLVCDAKVTIDDNASFRQQHLFNLQDESQEDPHEIAARRVGLNYVSLDGSIGCVVNGAGLAMATMDLLHLYGGKPANFLDVGGGAKHVQIIEAIKLLEANPTVKVIFINIFGGIMRCDIIAQGIVEASRQIRLTKPLLVRLEGTNKDLARNFLNASGVNIIFENNFNQAAKRVVALMSDA